LRQVAKGSGRRRDTAGPGGTSVAQAIRPASIPRTLRTEGKLGENIKTLVFAGGQIHDFRGVGGAARAALDAAGGFDVTYIEEDLGVLTRLDPYDLLVFHYTVGEISDAQKNGLLNWVALGKGYAGIRS